MHEYSVMDLKCGIAWIPGDSSRTGPAGTCKHSLGRGRRKALRFEAAKPEVYQVFQTVQCVHTYIYIYT